MKKIEEKIFTILIDQREKLPYSFTGYPVDVQTCTLHTGDYSFKTDTEDFSEAGICIERKSKQDLYQSLTHNRERFEREWARMNSYEYTALVVEDASFLSLLVPPDGNQTNPKSIIQSLVSWQIRYPAVHVFTMDNRRLSECLIYSLCEKYLYNKKRSEQIGTKRV